MGLGVVITVNGKPDAELQQAARIEVQQRMGETTWFSLSFSADIHDGDIAHLNDDRLNPGAVLSIAAEVNDELQYLVNGPVCSQQIRLVNGGAGSMVEVRGADTSITMDREIKSSVWTDVTDADAVTSILGGYNLVPDVSGTDTRHLETKHALVQRESDLRFVKRLARRNGCYFWLTCTAPGMETAHFKKQELNSEPVANITINTTSPVIDSLDISWDVERPTSAEGLQLDLNTKDDIDGTLSKTTQQSLGDKSLQDIATETQSVHVAPPVDDAGDLQSRADAALMEAEWFIRLTCSTNLARLGKIVRVHDLVKMEGAGSRHSGKYLVAAVKHIIDDADHIMELELVRNAWNQT